LSIVGQNIIQVYRNEGGMLVLIDECKVSHDICAMTYTSSIYGNSVESDLVVGTTTGSIGIFICGEFILSKEEAHSASITCLRLAELFGYKRVLMSGGIDGVVKIWDIKFHELSAKDIRSEIYSFRLNNQDKPQCSITSLDVYQCLKSNNSSKPSTLLLIGCSDGSVLEATIHNESQGNYLKSHTTQ
jgi:WD40 repeat protein